MKSSCENKIAMGCFFLLLIANYVLTNKLFFFLCALSLTFSFFFCLFCFFFCFFFYNLTL